jgi:hypothetical protein
LNSPPDARSRVLSDADSPAAGPDRCKDVGGVRVNLSKPE